MKRRTQMFLKESVILFGFLNGLFLAIGVNPSAQVLAIVRAVAENLIGAGGWIGLAFAWLPLALLAIALYLIHKRAGWWGFVAVGIAFLAGLTVLADARAGAILLLGALALGVVATR